MFNARMQVATLVAIGAGLVAVPAAFGASPGNSWGMDLHDDVVQDANGTQPLTFAGKGVRSTSGRVGGAVEFTEAPSFAKVADTSSDNPGAENFALGIVFSTQPIPGRGYSGNLIQKGRFGDPGQVKLQLVSKLQGTVSCRIKGTSGAETLVSSVSVDDGEWHTAVCWRTGSVVGLTVDGVVNSSTWDPGVISNGKPLTLGNKNAAADASDQHFGRTDFASWVIDADARTVVEQQVLSSG